MKVKKFLKILKKADPKAIIVTYGYTLSNFNPVGHVKVLKQPIKSNLDKKKKAILMW